MPKGGAESPPFFVPTQTHADNIYAANKNARTTGTALNSA